MASTANHAVGLPARSSTFGESIHDTFVCVSGTIRIRPISHTVTELVQTSKKDETEAMFVERMMTNIREGFLSDGRAFEERDMSIIRDRIMLSIRCAPGPVDNFFMGMEVHPPSSRNSVSAITQPNEDSSHPLDGNALDMDELKLETPQTTKLDSTLPLGNEPENNCGPKEAPPSVETLANECGLSIADALAETVIESPLPNVNTIPEVSAALSCFPVVFTMVSPVIGLMRRWTSRPMLRRFAMPVLVLGCSVG